MAGKGLRFLAPTALALIVASQWQDIVRYLKISQLSAGQGHPEMCRPGAGCPTRSAQAAAKQTATETSTRPTGAARRTPGDASQ
jgi:hypothetical protein